MSVDGPMILHQDYVRSEWVVGCGRGVGERVSECEYVSVCV